MNADVRSSRCQKSCAKNLAGYTDNCGSHVRSGRRQSMPSSNIDNCARVSETVPLVGLRPHEASALQSLREQTQPVTIIPQNLDQIASPSAKYEHLPGERLLLQLGLTIALSPVKPRRKSVTPAAIQMRVFAGNPIMLAGTPATRRTNAGSALPSMRTCACRSSM